MLSVICNEWKMLLRSIGMRILTAAFAILLILISYVSIYQQKEQQKQQKAASEHVRQQWEAIKEMNPHGAAHFGSYAFRPMGLLAALDEGVYAITGNVIRLEGHVQNEMVYSEASQSMLISKFGKLKASLLLQYVLPLLLIFLAFSSISSEKESGRITLLFIQGLGVRKLLFGKTIAVWLYGIVLLFLTCLTQLALQLDALNGDILSRICLWLLVYAGYYYVICLLSVYLSARLNNNTAALSSMLAIWVIWTLFIPKIWGNTIEAAVTLPSRLAFTEAMREDRKKGIDGHNPSDEREKAFREKILRKYGVDSVEQLPINFDGLVMQADEEYGNKVWDKHFGKLYGSLQKQKSMYQWGSAFNPFIVVQQLSMGFSGSDMLHHLHFQQSAENYRRSFIKTLNDKHAYGGSKTGDWSWTADSTFFRSVKDFDYHPPRLGQVVSGYSVGLGALLGWILLISIGCSWSISKMKWA